MIVILMMMTVVVKMVMMMMMMTKFSGISPSPPPPAQVRKVSFYCKFHSSAPYTTDLHLSRRARFTSSVCYTKIRTD
jgi:hypothetical protein